MISLEMIAERLEQHRQRATYGAVAGLVGRPATFLMAGQPRSSRYSWIVNQRTLVPTGYAVTEIHPELEANPRVLANANELAAWLGIGVELAEQAVDAQVPDERNLWSNLTTGELLGAYSGVMRALRNRGVVRSSNNPVADFAEGLAVRTFDLALAGKSAKGFDALDTDGGRWQVKGRRQTPENRSTQLGVLRGLAEHRFDWLLAVLFDEHFTVVAAYRIAHETTVAHALFSNTQKAHILHLKNSLLSDPGCTNVTLEVRAAAEAYLDETGSASVQAPLQ